MTDQEIVPGDIVVTTYKTGKYIAEYIERMNQKAIVKVLAVLRHPTQGDLHFPGKAEHVMFQQRKALAFHEKTQVHPASLQLYQKEVPSYDDSLRQAIEEEVKKLEQTGDAWSKRSIAMLHEIKNDYFKK